MGDPPGQSDSHGTVDAAKLHDDQPQYDPLIRLDLLVRNSQLINLRLPSAAELLTMLVNGDSRRNVWGAIADDKIDRNIPEQRQAERIQ
jgi:hypothetical protein